MPFLGNAVLSDTRKSRTSVTNNILIGKQQNIERQNGDPTMAHTKEGKAGFL